MDLVTWLDKQGLKHLSTVLEREGVGFDVLSSLSEGKLSEWGIVWGDRQRLMRAVAERGDPPGSRFKAKGPERRQMTVFFSDMVGSTALSTRVDPEDFREAIDRYIHAVNDAVAPYEGYIAKYMGDGILVYFGYPQAHEDDPQRAIYSALRAIKAVSKLKLHTGEALQTRIGIATGMVVIDETGAGTAAAETAATGQTMNLAARLQACAAPEEVVIADETRRLVGDVFDMQAIEGLELKGFSEKIRAWRVLGERFAQAKTLPQGTTTTEHSMQGREAELQLLWRSWTKALDTPSQAVLLAGEPGIGKTTLTHALSRRVLEQGGRCLSLKASPYFANTALYPITEALSLEATILHDDSQAARQGKLDRFISSLALAEPHPPWLLKLFGLLNDPNLDGLPASEQRRLTFEALRAVLVGLALQKPLFLLIEDGQWLDPTSENFVDSLVCDPLPAALLALVTARAEYRPSWSQLDNCLAIRLEKLSAQVALSIIGRITNGRQFPSALSEEIIRRTNGNPLFIEELTRSIVDSGLLIETANGFELRGDLSSLAVPSSLQDSLMARLDRMGPYKEVAQVASVIGIEFSHELLRYVLSTRPNQMLKFAVSDLIDADLWVEREVAGQPGFAFRHALMRETAYQSMLKGQRSLRHWQVAKAIEVLDKSAVEATPELLALHHQEAGLYRESVGYWTSAGARAALRSAHVESTNSLKQALTLLGYLDENEDRIRVEFEIQMRLGGVLLDAEGFNSDSAHSALHRAIALSSQLDDANHYIDACANISGTLQAKGAFPEVIRLLHDVSPAKRLSCAPSYQAKYFACLGISNMFLGSFDQAWLEFHEALQYSMQAEQSQRAGLSVAPPWSIPIRAYGAKVLAYRGQLHQAKLMVEEAHRIALDSTHVIERLSGLQISVWMHLLSGELGQAQSIAHDLFQESQRLGIKVRLAGVMSYLGEISLELGRFEHGCQTLEEAYRLLETYSGTMTLPEFATRAADAMLRKGLIDPAQTMLDRAAAVPLEAGRALVQAEYLRLMGRLAELRDNVPQAISYYREALNCARQQGAGLFALRAASHWFWLDRQREKTAEAREALFEQIALQRECVQFPDVVAAVQTLSSHPAL